MDIISTLPSGPIETILCLLPIQEAARTSILSKEWKYHWTKIPKLAFIEDTFRVSTDQDEYYEAPNKRKTMTKRCKFFNSIFQVLLMHEGPIHEFVLSVYTDVCLEIDQILFHLSKKYAVKKLTLDFLYGNNWLPIHLFSLHQLTDLCLIHCHIHFPSTLGGFGSLTSLSIQESSVAEKTLLHLLSNSPLLKSVDIGDLDMASCGNYTIINLLECFPLIEDLSILFGVIECFTQSEVPRELPTTLVHLKYLFIEDVSFIHKYGLPSIVLLIRSSPNLEKLKIQILEDSWVEKNLRRDSSAPDDCLDFWLEHLCELEIINMMYRKTELDFVKLILAKSPVLKKARIFFHNKVAKNEELEITRILSYPACLVGGRAPEV